MVPVIDELERDGYVRRDRNQADRRKQLISITEEGRRALGEALVAVRRAEEEFLAPGCPPGSGRPPPVASAVVRPVRRPRSSLPDRRAAPDRRELVVGPPPVDADAAEHDAQKGVHMRALFAVRIDKWMMRRWPFGSESADGRRPMSPAADTPARNSTLGPHID